jgi:hypothetical protein
MVRIPSHGKRSEEMNEQELLHRISVDTNLNIELLKDLAQNEEFRALVNSGKMMDAIVRVRGNRPIIGLQEAKMAVEAFAKTWK